ncbi:MAG: hypothetical protein IPM42_20660 [Saprospiraceae bacterium]|nr:hypothetical protein [Saprospiraceae bacterium]
MANIINSKNESKSQHAVFASFCLSGCGKYHKFKERKQITTVGMYLHTQISCGKYHKFKERKQITTYTATFIQTTLLWQIS